MRSHKKRTTLKSWEIEDVTKAVVASVKEDILSLVGATDFRIVAENGGLKTGKY